MRGFRDRAMEQHVGLRAVTPCLGDGGNTGERLFHCGELLPGAPLRRQGCSLGFDSLAQLSDGEDRFEALADIGIEMERGYLPVPHERAAALTRPH